ncbi:MAG: YadA-like family protein [[Actinobacillus] rossii]|nr:YadA-like family protein [[Actinobacillus] rossii]MDY5793986.1 YadA-like family protein [[Actinobacillus] rossii]
MTNGKIANLANATGSGDAVNLSQLKANTTKVVSGKNITITNATSADGTTYTINADDTSASVSTDSSLLTVTPNGSTAVGNATVTDYKVSLTQGSLTNSNGVTSATNGVATAQDVAKAINAGYWKVGNNTGIETAQIKFGDQVNFVNGKGTVSNVTGANVSFDVNVDGKTINVGSDGKLTVNTSALPKGVSVEAGKNTTVTSKAGTNGETIYTVDAEKTTASAGSNAITVEAGSKDANGVTNYSVDLSQTTKDQLAKADTAIQSFTTSVNGTQAETINKDNKDVNFVNGTGTTAEAKGSDITFNVKTTTLTTTDGKVEAGDKGDSFAKAGDVAEAINNASKAAKTEVKEGDNIVVTSEKGTDGQTIYTVKTAKDLVVDSVKAGDSTLNTNGLTIANGAAGQPVSLTKNGLNNGGNKITNVANGTVGAGSTDAVNGGQLQDVISKGFKINADNGTEDTVSLEESVKFTGNAGNIVTTVTNNTIAFALANNIKVGAANPITINGDAGTISGLTNKTFDPNNIVSGQAATEDQLKVVATTANSALQDFTTSVNGNVVETINKDSKDVNFVNGTGTTAAIANGSDITFNVNKSGLTTDAAGNVTADKTGDNFATAGDVANAINKASKATKTEVKEGDNIEVTSETGTNGQTIYTITTAKDLVVNTITTGGTVLNNNGLTINGGPSITRSGINAGDQKITSVAAGNISSTSTEAVNGSQLYQLQEAAKAAKTEVVAGKNTTVTSETGNNGQTIYTVNADKSVVEAKTDSGLTVTATTDADNYTTTYMLDLDEKTKKQLAKEETVKAGSSNIVVSEGTNSTGGKEFTVDLAKDIAVDTLKVGDTVNIDANGINAGNTKITGVATGTDDTDAVNVKQLTDTIAAAKTTVSSTDSSIVVVSSGNNYDISVKTDSATIRNGSNGLEVVTGDISTNSNGQAEVASGDETKVATAGTIKKAVNNASWTVKADKVKGTNGDATAYTGGDKVKAGDTVSVNAGNNIVISGSGKNINIATSDTPTFKSVTAKSVTADEVNITDGPSINTNGIDMNNKRITNVAPGRAGTNDVVNMNQLGDAIGNVNNKIHSVDKKLRSGIAGSVAIGSLVQAYNPSDTLLAVGGGTYRGASALALGYSKVSDNGKIIIKATGSVNNAGHYMGGASVGYRF